ncbi:oxidoreductase [Modestobacter sp. VKM Ac-2978]|uniref:oxidoreductase n=1 Tax=Modestobacter sp. VKM Ac-2978 TaxID=3004132 RepID=UPI0022AAFF1A|nr:oxidoreductase [Modestobacter sp. VKM Ac-2978]MCZ2850845.1 oxidoreductase [Modestobacter sp. VKM Ac-2978]
MTNDSLTHDSLTTTFPAIDLTGVRFLVTGGTKGIGAAIALHAAEAGADVVAAARSAAPGLLGVRFVQADVSTPAGVAGLMAESAQLLGGIDVLVNNVGNPTHTPAAAWEMADEDWLGDLNMNLMTAVRLDRAVIPSMIDRGSGVIIHMSSVVSRFPPAGLLPYATAKAALNNYSKGLSNEVARHGIRVNSVLPGLIETDTMTDHLAFLAEADGTDIDTARQAFTDGFSVPMGRMGHADDVARLVIFLTSAHARYLTGGRYAVDGGMNPAS